MTDIRDGRNPLHAIRGTVSGPGGTMVFTYCKLPISPEQEGVLKEAIDYRRAGARLANEHPEAYHPQAIRAPSMPRMR